MFAENAFYGHCPSYMFRVNNYILGVCIYVYKVSSKDNRTS